MNADLLLTTQAVATIMAMFSIICCAAKMTRATPAPVRMQHLVMFAGLSFSLVLPAMAGKTVLVLAVLMTGAAGGVVSAPELKEATATPNKPNPKI